MNRALIPLGGRTPRVDATAFVAPGARLVGDVTLAPRASVWFNAVLRADWAPIVIGEGSNVQDLTTLHVEGADELAPGSPERGVRIGRFTTVGHNCVVHACEIGDECLIGMHATVMSGATIGGGSVIAAGAVVREGMEVPPFSLVAGAPATIRKTYGPEILDSLIRIASRTYLQRTEQFLREVGGK